MNRQNSDVKADKYENAINSVRILLLKLILYGRCSAPTVMYFDLVCKVEENFQHFLLFNLPP